MAKGGKDDEESEAEYFGDPGLFGRRGRLFPGDARRGPRISRRLVRSSLLACRYFPKSSAGIFHLRQQTFVIWITCYTCKRRK